MLKISDFKTVLDYLKDGAIITSNGRDEFFLDKKQIVYHQDGTTFRLNAKDFGDLYCNTVFYLMEEEVSVDETKDEDYYRYYKK